MTSSCIIVGAGPGIGAAVARRFGREGFALGLVSRHPQALADELTTGGLRARAYPASAADGAALTAAIGQAQAELGPAGVLVYNPAAVRREALSEISGAELLERLALSVAGALDAVRAVLPGMRAARSGTIVFTGGGLALQPSAAYGSLSVGKAALRSLSLALSEELAPQGIHVATVTVAGLVQPGTAFDPERIAQTYWELYTKAAGQWQREVVVDGR